ncbi:MAG: hypothetical protein EA364_15195, partial [Balneolaceae bacterium]
MRSGNFMKSVFFVIGLSFLMFVNSVQPLYAGTIRIQVDAGAYDRQHTIVQFQLPVDLDPGTYILIRDDGTETPLQVDHQNRGWFILDALAAGSSAWYDLSKTSRISHESAHETTIQTGTPGHSGVSIQMDSAVLTLS